MLKQLSVLADARIVRKLTGKSVLRQALEIFRIKRRNPTLGATDYYIYRLYDSAYIGANPIEEFLGWRVLNDLALALNTRNVVLPAWDKLSFDMLARCHGLPVAQLRAVYKPGLLAPGTVADTVLQTPESLRKYLHDFREWPLFAKPSYSQQALGAFRLTGFDPLSGMLLTGDNQQLSLDGFISEITEGGDRHYYRPEMGYLFQEVLRPHPEIAALTGNQGLSGIRMVVAHNGTRFRPVTATMKLLRGNNHTDNFTEGTKGNLVAGIEMESGRLLSAIDGYWPNGKMIDHLNGVPVCGFQLPDWAEIVDLCLRAASVFPLMRVQHWDIAITDKGPILQELNDMGGVAFLQLHGKGLVQKPLRDALRLFADPEKYPWIRKLAPQ